MYLKKATRSSIELPKLLLISCMVCLFSIHGLAHAAKKVAWLVSNTSYPGAEALRNSSRDADLLNSTLKQAGYDALISKNLNVKALDDSLKAFRTRALKADVALVFYAAHGLAYNGHNYMVPVDKRVSNNLLRSMSRKPRLPDNATCEGIFGKLKTEMFYLKDRPSNSADGFITKLDNYIHWYNKKRVKALSYYLSPIEYREVLGFLT